MNAGAQETTNSDTNTGSASSMALALPFGSSSLKRNSITGHWPKIKRLWTPPAAVRDDIQGGGRKNATC
jgi:hypothetical protein